MPQHAYWTIVLPDGPTSFRARDRETLEPTLKQLQSRTPDAAMKWFANGRLWESPEAAHEFARLARLAWRKTRGPDWRPGGEHRDPRARFKMPKAARPKRTAPGAPPAPGEGRSPSARPARAPRPKGRGPDSKPTGGQPFGRDARQRRPYRPTGGSRRGGGSGGSRGGGGRGRS